jgi:hypothetical protein
MSLQLVKAGSFKKDRKVQGSEETVKSRRYRYQVIGSKKEMELYRSDIENGFPGGEDHEEFGLVFYSWEPILPGMELERGRQKDDQDYTPWFINDEDLDSLESMSKKYPHLMKGSADKIISRLFDKAPTKKVEPIDQPETEDEESDLNN